MLKDDLRKYLLIVSGIMYLMSSFSSFICFYICREVNEAIHSLAK